MKRQPKYTRTYIHANWLWAKEVQRLYKGYAEREKRCEIENAEYMEYKKK
jgi:hypothetical protein